MDMKVTGEKTRKSIEVFCCYARKDQSLLLDLKTHLAPLQQEGLITLWADIDINAGMEWEKEIHRHLNSAQIVLLLISPDFIASEYCYSVEMRRAMQRHESGEARVIPIILRPVLWQGTPFGKIQALPTNANPSISRNWHHQDEAFYSVAQGVREAAEAILEEEQRSKAEEAERIHRAEEERQRQAEEERVRQAEEAKRHQAEEQARRIEEERVRQAEEEKSLRETEEQISPVEAPQLQEQTEIPARTPVGFPVEE
jgi:DNA segregation ATPase FtsK/SpoIIIE-like protein